MDVSGPEKMGSVALPAVRSTAKVGRSGAGGNDVEITGAVIGSEEADGMSPQALRVIVPAPIPINLMKSLRVSLFFEIMLFVQFLYQSMILDSSFQYSLTA
jgi:hypothetical protein